MAKKQKTVYICTECGNESNGWQGQCSFCGAWNSIVEQKVAPAPKESDDTRRRVTPLARPVPLSEVGTQNYSRIHSGSRELDRVLGDGIVLGSLILISGEPGIGKSTLIVQAANHIAGTYGKVLYVSGEESEEQVKLRADRVCGKISENLYIFPETNLENVLAHCENLQPCFVIIDSIQTVYSGGIDSVAGSVSQIRTCSNLLMNFAKTKNVPVMIVAHVTKSGELAGPKTIEHMVDCVLQFNGERDRDLRVLRSLKNRFGTTEEIGAFRMGPEGMKEETDLSGSLLENTDVQEEGSLVSAIYEGSRPVFFEIQALVSPSNVGFARRTALGIDQNRLNMILAVLEKKAGISLLNYDVYVNVVGGMRPDSTATDLAVALAIFSSFRGKCAAAKTIAIGEIGLTGNLRSVRNAEKIAAETVRLGYEKIILPKKNSKFTLAGISIVGAENIMEAIRQAY